MMKYKVSAGLTKLGPILRKTFSKMDKIFHHNTESCYLCQNMGHVLIGIFLNVLGAQYMLSNTQFF